MSFELKHPTVEDLEKARKYYINNPHAFVPTVPGSLQCALCRLREHNPIHIGSCRWPVKEKKLRRSEYEGEVFPGPGGKKYKRDRTAKPKVNECPG
jgi:hypothetical protein